jgi:hypothetical protein
LDSSESAAPIRPGGNEGGQVSGSIRLGRRRLELAVRVDGRTSRDIRLIRGHPRIAFWLFACVLIYLVWQRCPTAISHAQFWAEDGWVWYPQCYAVGWRCIIIDHTGYLQTISRIVALLSLLWPLASAPKVFAIAALLMQAAPAIFLVSPRMAPAIPAVGVRVALALLLVAIPGMSEVYVNLTNSQWHLALLAFLILAAAPATTWTERGFDTLGLIVSGLSGPFAPLLLPAALLAFWHGRGRWQVWRLAIILATAALQFSLVLLHQSSRRASDYGLGWSPNRLINIIDTDILGVAAFGRQTLINRYWLVGDGEGWLSNGHLLPTLIAACIGVAAVGLAITAFMRGRWILQGFLIFTGLELAASLVDGLGPGMPVWVAMENGVGMRYYFHPIAAWLAILLTITCDRNLLLRTIGVAVLALTITIAVPADWNLPKLSRSSFHREAKAFDRAPPGTVMTFTIRPLALHDMVLVRH